MSVKRGTASTVGQLLENQGGPVRRHPAFPELVRLVRESPALRDSRLDPTAYRLLDGARLEARYLPNFFRTYRVAESPFFALFLAVKRERRQRALDARVSRGERILAIMRTYPKDVLGLVRYLAKAERARNADFPVWKKELFPRSLKRARELASFGLADWIPALSRYIEALRGRYRGLVLPGTDILLAGMLLRSLPDPRSGAPPDAGRVDLAYRALRAAYLSGDAEERSRLPLLDAARTTLLEAARRYAAAGLRGSRPTRKPPRRPS